MMESQNIIDVVQKALPGSQVSVKDLTGTKDHFRVTVVASQLEGKMMIEQHRMLYDIMNPYMEANGGGIHALSLATYTPGDWKKFGKEK